MDLAWFLLVGRELGEEKGEKAKFMILGNEVKCKTCVCKINI